LPAALIRSLDAHAFFKGERAGADDGAGDDDGVVELRDDVAEGDHVAVLHGERRGFLR